MPGWSSPKSALVAWSSVLTDSLEKIDSRCVKLGVLLYISFRLGRGDDAGCCEQNRKDNFLHIDIFKIDDAKVFSICAAFLH